MATFLDYLVSAKLIEFFWFLVTIFMFVYVVVVKFYLKQEIHKIDSASTSGQKYEQKPAEAQDEQIQIVSNIEPNQQNQIPNASQLQSVNLAVSIKPVEDPNVKQVQDNLPMRFLKGVERVYDIYLPLLSVVILCINSFASFGFAVFCVVAYFISFILFNELDVQKNLQSAIARGVLKFIMHFWLLCLFINYFVVDQSY